jgi:hypothetical protein
MVGEAAKNGKVEGVGFVVMSDVCDVYEWACEAFLVVVE